MKRFIRKNYLTWNGAVNSCRLCGSYTIVPPEVECRPTTCLWCGSRQCMSNGLGNGTCSICFHGLLPGWSGTEGKICSFKNCNQPAIARGRQGKKYVCKDHVEHQFPGYLTARLTDRDKQWYLTDESPNSPYK